MSPSTDISTATTTQQPNNFSQKQNANSEKNTLNKIQQTQKQPRPRRKKKKGKQQPSTESLSEAQEDDVEIEYIAEPILEADDPNYQQFSHVFQHFSLVASTDEPETTADDAVIEEVDEERNQKEGGSDMDSDDEEKRENGMSKKKQKKLNRLSVAELKQLVTKPEVVEWVDVTATDPKLLVYLKAYRNTVPVPQHWSQKRKYLQNKRGIEKAPFDLPDFIKDTGIMEIRSAVKEKEEQQKLKSKTRERMAPKMGKIDIDYQKLHDAFFRYQTKPKLTMHGELYYEGKEFETKLKERKPGDLSLDLVAALNIPPLAPAPWLINMQRYGPPPSYSSLRIPGLNAPIPEGAQWGYHPGGWGKPPVDEYNRPLYGDVFGMTQEQKPPAEIVVPVEKDLWGQLESEDEEEEEEEEEEEQEEEESKTTEEDELREGLVTPSGLASVPSGLETPEFIELRKDSRRSTEDEGPKQLYQVLQQRETSISGFMGSQHTYDVSNVPSASAAAAAAIKSGTKRKMGQGVEVALDPSEMEHLDEAALQAKYDAAQHEHEPEREDFSDMVAEHAGKQAKKRKKQEDAKSAKDSSKKGKEYKF